MPNDDLSRCRVCGLELDEPPWGLDGKTPLFEHCSCCGVEFGYQDATPAGARKFREAWVASGAVWDEPARKPAVWSVEVQLAKLPEGFR